MLSIEAVKNDVDSLVSAMLDKGLIQPKAEYHIKSNEEGSITLSWLTRPYDPAKYDRDIFVSKYFRGEPAASVGLAQAFIDEMPGKAERDKSEFMALLAETVEYGNKVGIEVDHMNPLLEAMKRLSENIITHEKA